MHRRPEFGSPGIIPSAGIHDERSDAATRVETTVAQRHSQRADAPAAMCDCRDAEQATLDKIRRLRALREACAAAVPPAKG
jgi:hypothetical protein